MKKAQTIKIIFTINFFLAYSFILQPKMHLDNKMIKEESGVTKTKEQSPNDK